MYEWLTIQVLQIRYIAVSQVTQNDTPDKGITDDVTKSVISTITQSFIVNTATNEVTSDW